MCTGFNNCQFVITQTKKFGIAKLPKTFHKNREKKCERKKNKELRSFENRNKNTNFRYCGRKKALSIGKFNANAKGGQGDLTLYLGSLKYVFLEHRVRPKKPTRMQKSIITSNPINLIKVAYISSILKFLNTKSFVVSNTKFNIQCLNL